MKHIFVYGDSISMQWGKFFEKLVDGRYEYDRLGNKDSSNLSDEKTNGGSTRKMLSWIRKIGMQKNTVLLFNCGLHDIKRDLEGEDSLSVDEYADNLEKIIDYGQQKFEKMIWISSTPVDDEQHRKLCKTFIRKDADIKEYNWRAREVMNDRNIPIIDLYRFTKNFGKQNAIYMDHVHMKEEFSRQQALFIVKKVIDNLEV